jgi:hypothetical protein
VTNYLKAELMQLPHGTMLPCWHFGWATTIADRKEKMSGCTFFILQGIKVNSTINTLKLCFFR